jgi:hypothetical protein
MVGTFTLVASIVVALCVGAAVAWWAANKGFDLVIYQRESRVAGDHNDYLMVLRREIGNYLVRRDPMKFLMAYRKNHHELKRYEGFSKAALQGEFVALCERFRYLRDFDTVGVRPHVLYEDALDWISDDDVLERYWTICRFQRLKTLLDEHWEYFDVTSDEDLKHCEEYTRKILDAKFAVRVKNAIDTYYLARSETGLFYENSEFFIRPLNHFAEVRYGVGFKDTDEFGIYSVFHFDDRDRKPLIHYYRSDSSFTREDSVDKMLSRHF